MPILASLGAGSIGSYRLFRRAGAAAIIGSAGYTIPGTYSWVAPTGVTSVSVVAIAGV